MKLNSIFISLFSLLALTAQTEAVVIHETVLFEDVVGSADSLDASLVVDEVGTPYVEIIHQDGSSMGLENPPSYIESNPIPGLTFDRTTRSFGFSYLRDGKEASVACAKWTKAKKRWRPEVLQYQNCELKSKITKKKLTVLEKNGTTKVTTRYIGTVTLKVVLE